MDKRDIEAFWKWFVDQHDQLSQLLHEGATEKLSEMIATRMSDHFPQLGWEIGPGVQAINFLAITLNADLDNLPLATEVVSAAPPIDGWEFRVGRPRREFNGQLHFTNRRGQKVEVDLTDWRYVLTAFDGGRFFDIKVATKHPLHADQVGQEQLLYTAVSLMLGELDMLQHIDRVEWNQSPKSEWDQASTPFAYLAEHLDSIKRS